MPGLFLKELRQCLQPDAGLPSSMQSTRQHCTMKVQNPEHLGACAGCRAGLTALPSVVQRCAASVVQCHCGTGCSTHGALKQQALAAQLQHGALLHTHTLEKHCCTNATRLSISVLGGYSLSWGHQIAVMHQALAAQLQLLYLLVRKHWFAKCRTGHHITASCAI